MPAEAEANEKVTITLQHHGQLENNFASNETTYHHRHQLDFSGETFRIKPVRFIFKGLEEIMRIYCRLESCAKCPWGTTSTLRLPLSIRKGRDEKQWPFSCLWQPWAPPMSWMPSTTATRTLIIAQSLPGWYFIKNHFEFFPWHFYIIQLIIYITQLLVYTQLVISKMSLKKVNAQLILWDKWSIN